MSRPRLNHVAISMPAELLDDAGRAEIVDFYREVFGWEPFATNEASNPLVMGTGVFVVLQARAILAHMSEPVANSVASIDTRLAAGPLLLERVS